MWFRIWTRIITNYKLPKWWNRLVVLVCSRLHLCESCGKPYASYIVSQTAYPYKGKKNSYKDPNRKLMLCDECAKEYCDYWHEQWNEYYHSLGVYDV